MNTLNLGISSWCYPWSVGVAKGPQPDRRMSARELLEKAEEYGVDRVQIADNLALENLSPGEITELAEYARVKGISVEIGTKGTGEAHLLHMLDVAKIFHSPILRTLPALFGKRAEMEVVERELRGVLPRFADEGITLVLENTEAFRASEYAGLMQRVDHPNLRMCVDLSNALGTMEGPEYVLGVLLPYCGNFHFKDVIVRRSETLMGFTVEGVPSGKGQLPLKWILAQLESTGRELSFIIELWPPWQGTMEETLRREDAMVRESVENLKIFLDQ